MYQDQSIEDSLGRSVTISKSDNNTSAPIENLKAATSKKEKRYFLILSVVSVVSWFVFTISIIGPIIFSLLIVMTWFFNGLFVAYIRSEAVRISRNQAPELYDAFLNVCKCLGLEKIPELYVAQAGGTLNAFVTKHSGRNFIVLYSDIVESYGFDSPEVSFLIGHEIGHIQRKHIFKSLFLMPSRIIPLLSEAYDRACEATCDRFGAIASKNYEASKTALMILSGGKELGRKMNSMAYIDQYKEERGFFVSCHELLSGYPTMSQRVFNIHEILNNREPKRSSRNILAYPISVLVSLSKNFIAIYILAIIVIAGGSAMEKQSFSSIVGTYLGLGVDDSESSAISVEDYDSDEESGQENMTVSNESVEQSQDITSNNFDGDESLNEVETDSNLEAVTVENNAPKVEVLKQAAGDEQQSINPNSEVQAIDGNEGLNENTDDESEIDDSEM
jgi:Zn-dependent protease with chaperone function